MTALIKISGSEKHSLDFGGSTDSKAQSFCCKFKYFAVSSPNGLQHYLKYKVWLLIDVFCLYFVSIMYGGF